MRIDPPPSVPILIGPKPAATAAPAPPLLPPGVSSRFQGLRVIPNRRLSVTPFQPNSGVFVRPMMIAPACRNRSTAGASSWPTFFSYNFEPNVSGAFFIASRSLIDTGTPCSGPSIAPLITSASARRAACRASSASTVQ
jgi:hypothetical protein